MARTLQCSDPVERPGAVLAASRAAKNGRLVVLPAETGYVVATDAFAPGGVAALQRAKGLAPTTTLGVLVGHAAAVHGIAARVPTAALDLIAACWPGNLSLVVRTQPSLQWTVPTDRCVVRMPLHPLLLEVVGSVGPMVFSGIASPADWDSAAVILDCGTRPAGPGSTVVDVTTSPPTLIREGAVPAGRLRDLIGDLGVPG